MLLVVFVGPFWLDGMKTLAAFAAGGILVMISDMSSAGFARLTAVSLIGVPWL